MAIQVFINGTMTEVTKQQLFVLAARNAITPDTAIIVNGTHATAGRVQGIVFGSQAETAQNVPMSNGRETPRDMVQDSEQLTPVDPALRLCAALIDGLIPVVFVIMWLFVLPLLTISMMPNSYAPDISALAGDSSSASVFDGVIGCIIFIVHFIIGLF